jgi:hypothetical protein
MIARIYGLYPSPSVIYNAIPWSWLIDWFSNAGDCIENAEAGVANRLAADYFYVMNEYIITRVRGLTVQLFDRNQQVYQAHGTATATSSFKIRGAGDPFGWGTNPNGLNESQLAILGALGLSRL